MLKSLILAIAITALTAATLDEPVDDTKLAELLTSDVQLDVDTRFGRKACTIPSEQNIQESDDADVEADLDMNNGQGGPSIYGKRRRRMKKHRKTKEKTSGPCTFVDGDGTGGKEVDMMTKTSTEEECAAHVKETWPKANGATWLVKNKKCYAEEGMTGCKSNTLFDKRRTCKWGPPVAVDKAGLKDFFNKIWKKNKLWKEMMNDKCSQSAAEGAHCVCIKNKEGKKFCCTRKISTAKFIQQFMLWFIKSCTASVLSAVKCVRAAVDEKFVAQVIKVLTCFTKKSGKKLKSDNWKTAIKHAREVVWKDFKDGLSDVKNLFGEEILDQMLDGRNKALLAQELVSPHGLNDRSLNKLPDNMDDYWGSKVKFSGIPEDLALDTEWGGGAAC